MEKGELKVEENWKKISKRELFLKIMRKLGKNETILIRENGTKIRI